MVCHSIYFCDSLEYCDVQYLLYKQAGFPPSNLGDAPQNHEQGVSLNAGKGWNTTLCRLCWIRKMELLHGAG